MKIAPSHRWFMYALAAGGGLLAYAIVLACLGRSLDSSNISRDHALVWLASAGVVIGTVYIAVLLLALRRSVTIPLTIIFSIAIIARLVVCAAPPSLESDYHRYLWDGGVVANGMNPYRYAPDEVVAGFVKDADVESLRILAEQAEPILSRINHPHLTTVYPPLAQLGFAIAHVIDPFGVAGWRCVLFLADAITALLLLRLLKILSLPSIYIAWYAWNPLLLREVYSSLHMDMLVLPIVAGALLAGVRHRHAMGAALCVIGSAVKVWPILLAPLLMRPLLSKRRHLFITIAFCIALFALLWAPLLFVSQQHNSGFLAYSSGWQNNDGFFRAGIWLTERILTLLSIEPWHSHQIMRIISACLVFSVLLWQFIAKSFTPGDLPRRCLFVVGAIFLLSPTQFPWYWLWCLPFITIIPRTPLVLYAALLPLYYLQDFTQAVYWIEHVPVWGLLAVELIRGNRPARAMQLQRCEVAHA